MYTIIMIIVTCTYMYVVQQIGGAADSKLVKGETETKGRSKTGKRSRKSKIRARQT